MERHLLVSVSENSFALHLLITLKDTRSLKRRACTSADPSSFIHFYLHVLRSKSIEPNEDQTLPALEQCAFSLEVCPLVRVVTDSKRTAPSHGYWSSNAKWSLSSTSKRHAQGTCA